MVVAGACRQSYTRSGSGLAGLDALPGDLDNYYPLHAARGEALRRLGRSDEARVDYERAAALATSTTDREYFNLQLQDLSSRSG